ncbi:hypothetical protein BDV09DRAFT_168276 [Aspergillus tetrazonus]
MRETRVISNNLSLPRTSNGTLWRNSCANGAIYFASARSLQLILSLPVERMTMPLLLLHLGMVTKGVAVTPACCYMIIMKLVVVFLILARLSDKISYTGAWTWTDNNDNLKSLTDPQDKIVYEMHHYLDTDGSGTHETCVSETIGAERVESATQ